MVHLLTWIGRRYLHTQQRCWRPEALLPWRWSCCQFSSAEAICLESHLEDIPEHPSEDCQEYLERLDTAAHEKTDPIRIQISTDSYLFTHILLLWKWNDNWASYFMFSLCNIYINDITHYLSRCCCWPHQHWVPTLSFVLLLQQCAAPLQMCVFETSHWYMLLSGTEQRKKQFLKVPTT